SFLKDVLMLKKFNNKWIEWMMKAWRKGAYFRSYKGLRQGDSLSPLLVNLIVDTFVEILKKASKKGIIKGLVPELVDGGLTHLEYADDTILFLSDLEEEFSNVKFLLFCFKEMSRMRINYNMSEVCTVGLKEEDKLKVANMFQCKLGEFPMKYLGMPNGDRRLTKGEMKTPMEKVKKSLRLENVLIYPMEEKLS
ncbi:LOW QUALITY PROTEIN: hypothetical protein U9M48_019204, partial [Paspalum notatum var. saurae]